MIRPKRPQEEVLREHVAEVRWEELVQLLLCGLGDALQGGNPRYVSFSHSVCVLLGLGLCVLQILGYVHCW